MSFRNERVRPSGSVADVSHANGRAYSSSAAAFSSPALSAEGASGALDAPGAADALGEGFAEESNPWTLSQPERPATRQRMVREARTRRTAIWNGFCSRALSLLRCRPLSHPP